MDVIYTLNANHLEDLHRLYQQEWWTKTRTLQETIQCVQHTPINIGLVDSKNTLIAYARVVTDFTFKALICDVIVAKSERGKGLSNTLLELIKHHEQLKTVKSMELYCLPDMAAFYEKHQFSSDVGGIQLMRLTK